MRQLTHTAPGRVEWITAPEPSLASRTDALVRPLAAATCDFDHLVVGGRLPLGFPTALGHEAIAEVVDIGDGVTRFVPGERVVIPFQVSCGTCARCEAGLTSSCQSVPWLSCFGLGDVAGGYGGLVSDLVRIPYADAMLVPLPPSLDPVVAASIGCNIVDAYRCVAPPLQQRPGSSVLVVAGAFDNIALYAALIAQSCGAGDVVLAAEDAALQDRAGRAGIAVTPTVPTDSRFDITVDASMDPRLLHQTVRATAAAGLLTISTMYPADSTPLPLLTMFERCLTVTTGQPHARALVDPVLAALEGGLDLGIVTDEVLAWEDAPRAFTRQWGKRVVVRDELRSTSGPGPQGVI